MAAVFEGKLIVVTGAAGGIGRVCVSRLLLGGARLHLIDTHSAGLAEILRTHNGQGRITAACSSLETPRACSDALAALQQPVYGVLHLAGVYERDELSGESRTVWDRAIAANLTSGYDLASASVPRLDRDQVCRMVFTSSLAFRRGSADHIGYSAAKGGVAGLVRSLARRLAPKVLVNGIAPGLVETAMTRGMIAEHGQAMRSQIPLERWAQPDEVASVAEFLLGPGSSYITGQIINCDGGVCMD